MTGNSYGALKGKLTRHCIELAREESIERSFEISRNKDRWFSVIEELKSIDNDFELWYNSKEIPDYIVWFGKEFEEIFYTTNERLILIRRRNDNE